MIELPSDGGVASAWSSSWARGHLSLYTCHQGPAGEPFLSLGTSMGLN